jgi:hypothetical protein
VAPAALAVAVVAAIVAIWALSSAQGVAQPASFTAQQSDAAKTRACGAFDVVRKAVSVQTNADLGADPVAREAVAANARLAALGGGGYLLSRLDPATPADVADPVRRFADDVGDIGMSQLVGTPNSDPRVAALLTSAQEASARVAQACR